MYTGSPVRNFVISFKNVSKEELQQIYDEIVEAFENTEVEGKKIPLKVYCRRNIYGTLYEGDERGPQPSDLCVEPFPA